MTGAASLDAWMRRGLPANVTRLPTAFSQSTEVGVVQAAAARYRRIVRFDESGLTYIERDRPRK